MKFGLSFYALKRLLILNPYLTRVVEPDPYHCLARIQIYITEGLTRYQIGRIPGIGAIPDFKRPDIRPVYRYPYHGGFSMMHKRVVFQWYLY